MNDDWEPLLPDDRVGRIAELLLVAFPQLPRDTEIFTFVVPSQTIKDRTKQTGLPHDEGCAYAYGNATYSCSCGPYTVPEQAVFAIRTAHPRTWDPVYKGKSLLSTSGMVRSVWDSAERVRRHYVSPREDPAWGPFYISAVEHVKKMRGYRELI